MGRSGPVMLQHGGGLGTGKDREVLERPREGTLLGPPVVSPAPWGRVEPVQVLRLLVPALPRKLLEPLPPGLESMTTALTGLCVHRVDTLRRVPTMPSGRD